MHSQKYSRSPLASSQVGVAREQFPLTALPQPSDSEAVIDSILHQFSASGFDPDSIAFTDETDGMYTDISIAEHRLRVYAIVDLAPQTSSLFLILGSLKGSYLPMGSRLSVRENHLLLAEQRLHWTEQSAFVYTQVFGSWQEKFTIEIVLPNAHPKVLAPLMVGDSQSSEGETAPTIGPAIDRLAA